MFLFPNSLRRIVGDGVERQGFGAEFPHLSCRVESGKHGVLALAFLFVLLLQPGETTFLSSPETGLKASSGMPSLSTSRSKTPTSESPQRT